MTPEEYAGHMKILDMTHKQIGDAIGISAWSSASYRTGRRVIPMFVEVALRAAHYRQVAGDLVNAEIDRRFAIAATLGTNTAKDEDAA